MLKQGEYDSFIRLIVKKVNYKNGRLFKGSLYIYCLIQQNRIDKSKINIALDEVVSDEKYYKFHEGFALMNR